MINENEYKKTGKILEKFAEEFEKAFFNAHKDALVFGAGYLKLGPDFSIEHVPYTQATEE